MWVKVEGIQMSEYLPQVSKKACVGKKRITFANGDYFLYINSPSPKFLIAVFSTAVNINYWLKH